MKLSMNFSELQNIISESSIILTDKSVDNRMKNLIFMTDSKGTRIVFYKKGDIESFGKLVTESGESSINNWETGSKEMIELFNIIKSCEGVYGARLSGSGFKEDFEKTASAPSSPVRILKAFRISLLKILPSP